MGQTYSECSNLTTATTTINNAVSDLNAKVTAYNTNITNLPTNNQLQYLQSDLSGQIQNLNEEIKQLKGTIERHNRDFIDLESTTEPNTSSIHVLDDYTLWMLVLSYMLFAFSIVFMYSHTHYYSISSILLSVAGMTLITFFLFVLAIIIL
jgi:hypothetical protein